jgi:hypothetical protein
MGVVGITKMTKFAAHVKIGEQDKKKTVSSIRQKDAACVEWPRVEINTGWDCE